jgi:hypothetical protein
MKKKSIGVLLCMVLILAFGMNAWAGEEKGRAEKKKQIVQAYYQAEEEMKADVVQKMFTPDAKFHINGRRDFVGSDYIYKIVTMIGKLFKNFHNDIHSISVTDDGLVYAQGTHSGTLIDSTAPGFPGKPVYYQSPIGPLLVQGQTLKWQAVIRFKFNDKLQIEEILIASDELGQLMGAGTVTLKNLNNK